MSFSFLAHLQKSKNKDFGGAIVQNQYVFKGFCEFGSSTCTKEPYCKKLALYLAYFCHSAVLKNSTLLNFRLRIMQVSAKICLFRDFWK